MPKTLHRDKFFIMSITAKTKVVLYGLSNCDTIKKARRWLTKAGIEYHFHDYRKNGLNQSLLEQWADELDWQQLLNRRGTTWRQLTDEQKNSINRDQAIQLMLEYPAMIKRPLLDTGTSKVLGFSADRYRALFSL